MSADIATLCTEDITARIKGTGEFGDTDKEKVFAVYSEEDLMDKAKFLKMPCVGVMYEGIDPITNSSGGMAAECTIAIALLLDGKAVGNLDRKNEAARIMDVIRKSIRTATAPSQHQWKYAGEKPVGQVSGVIIYLQRWKCPVILTN